LHSISIRWGLEKIMKVANKGSAFFTNI